MRFTTGLHGLVLAVWICVGVGRLRRAAPAVAAPEEAAASCPASVVHWGMLEGHGPSNTEGKKIDVPKINDVTIPLWQQQNATTAGSASNPDVVALYAEVSLIGAQSKSQKTPALYSVLGTHLAAVGLLASEEGHFAVLRVRGGSSDAQLLEAGRFVDVRRTPAPKGPPGVTFKGIDAFSEFEEPVQSDQTLGFLLRLSAEVDEYGVSAHNWHGWPRSLPVRLEGYVRQSEAETWQLLGVVRTHVVTDGVKNFGAFLGNVGSSVEVLSTDNCGAGDAQSARFGAARFAEAKTMKWQPFATADVPGGAAAGDASTDKFVLKPASAIAGEKVKLSVDTTPALLKDNPDPHADLGVVSKRGSDGLTNLERVRLAHWGTPYEKSKDKSCLTPDYPAVQADPLQAAPTGPPPDMNAFCPVLHAEHFWWHPPAAVPVPKDIEWFYNEITVDVTGPRTYFMANGFAGGYMGIQEHEDSNHRFALFSVWDAATKVEIVDWGEDVIVGRFGAEGTGANSHTLFAWEVGKPVGFLVRAQPEPPLKGQLTGSTLYTGYIHDHHKGIWRLMAKFRVRQCGPQAEGGGHLLGFNSFLEVFEPPPAKPNCSNYGVTRVARYGPAFFGRAGSTTGKNFEVFPNVSLSSTCAPHNCPQTGLNFYETASQQQVLTVGKTVKNDGKMPFHIPRPVKPKTPPEILTVTSLPSLDNSPAGKTEVKQSRPLSKWGKQAEFKSWGAGGKYLECPWYVVDCAPSGYGDAYGRSP
eukprot:gnl/MRDRNA2_/MRDRNA2_71662_c0_seq1.p1 gnl/MRDRNA2_/MRDRNA2_71662_c0~~gnl/MRDRNA2_/MRDRNA2_71662_c0_seq1.p1  ORF type:complete len:751 (-),score=142.79 gnl/MRDRNA2_/MRDRNA2_71662_c0_seq1:9-2261(-)